MAGKQRDLVIPAEVTRDLRSSEVLRAWVANEGLVCSLRPDIWDEPANWGILLADVARHVANAVHDLNGSDPDETIAQIKTCFDSELTEPTDEASGHFED